MNRNPTQCINNSPVQSAGVLTLRDQLSQVPNQNNTIKGWFKPLLIGWITTKWKDGESEELTQLITVMGHLQPSEPEKLEIQMSGDRSWKFYYLYVDNGLIMQPDDRCIIDDTPYRIIGKKDWKEAGFIRYRCHEDYTDAHAVN
jgi:hypothetical protein